ncbi:ABC transporter permease [Tenggerimyces flavus]|uniref:Transport permease protein n=1 Tax=Tenggerimyces flavus TaxID=1708749 RepID=A0ABV7Y2E4_9ACTN|nr:ABC transporter permease [Tenggerimyces flavus]MBM7790726.1 teichoic acid transport system permease protein [Tenggerimyces flavus]
MTSVTETPSELARRYGLSPSSARPPFFSYIRQLWERRYFIRSFATSRTVTMYAGARLGQLWQVLTPLLNAAVYFLLFGLLLQTSRSIPNFIAFLVTGVFVFSFTQRSVTSGASAITSNLGLIRALHFPRATLPLTLTLIELQQMLISVGVLVVIVLLTGEPVTWAWLLIIPALILQTIFNTGLCMALARIGSRMTDITQLLPFITRTWLYMSGVFFSIPQKMHHHPKLRDIMMGNPATVYIELVRDAFMDRHDAPSWAWLAAIVWAVVMFCVGFWYFWRAEETYGRG